MIDRVITYTDYNGTEKTEHFYFNMTKVEMDEAHKVKPTTNCVNCGAVIDPNVDHCEYCGTSYKLMGIRCAPKKVSKGELLTRHAKLNAERRARLERDRLQLETELLQAKTKALSDYEDVLNAMRAYDRVY